MSELARLLGIIETLQAKSVRIGSLIFPPDKAEDVLQRYCKHVFVLNFSEAHPYSFRGSATAVRFGSRHLLLCCGHQFPDLEPDVIAIRPVAAPDKTVTASKLFIPKADDPAADHDFLDMRAFEFRPDDYDIPNIGSDFLPVDDTSMWPEGSRQQHRFFVFGYPFTRQNIDYESPHITARVTAVGGTYDGRSASPWVHRLRMERTEVFDTDGMSGGPVFYVGGGAGTFFMGFAGVVIRGGATSEILHFVEASFFRRFAEW